MPPHHGSIKLRSCAEVNVSTATEDYNFLKSLVLHRIRFGHPAYPPGHDTLFTLPAFDHQNGGIHHGLALSICAVISNNRNDGFFSLDRDKNATCIDAAVDDVLQVPPQGKLYYFHVPAPLNSGPSTL